MPSDCGNALLEEWWQRLGLSAGMKMKEAVRFRSPGKVPQTSECHCCKGRQDSRCLPQWIVVANGYGLIQGKSHGT